MLMLKFLGVVAVLSAIIYGLRRFNRHTEERFSYKFFSASSFLLLILGALLLWGGLAWQDAALLHGGDPLNGVVVAALGALSISYCWFNNLRNTSLSYALLGTVLQSALFIWVGFLLAIYLILKLIFVFFIFGNSESVSII